MAAVMEPFLLERYFAEHEFATPHLLCSSDLESVRDARAGRAPPTPRRPRSGTTCASAIPRRPATRCCEPSWPRCTTTVDADDVVTFAGASEAITCLVSGLVGPGDHVIATWPAYQSLYAVAQGAGADVTTSSCAPRTAGRSTSTRSRRRCARERA